MDIPAAEGGGARAEPGCDERATAKASHHRMMVLRLFTCRVYDTQAKSTRVAK
jgi:hypothetical protein